jgi:hypothetical protein
MTRSATYLYAVSRPIPPVALLGLRGIGGGCVRALPVGELTCVVSSADLTEFDEEPLRENLENLGWLERVARQHDDVVQAVAALATTVPLRLATICRDDSSARERVQALHGEALRVLELLDGREEWGVKLYDVPEPAGATAGATVGAAAGGTSGTAYLQRRREQLAQQARAGEAAAEDAERFFAEVGGAAVLSKRHRPQDPHLSGVASPMLLNASFLVDRERSTEFRATVDRLAGDRPPGAVVLTGPWPAYSFAALEEA